jgi:hypothetical protein
MYFSSTSLKQLHLDPPFVFATTALSSFTFSLKDSPL